MRSIQTAVSAAAVLLLTIAGCGEGLPEEALPEDATEDDRLGEIGRRVPGFGGMFVDEAGQLQVYVSEAAPLAQGRPEDLRSALSAVLGKDQMQGGLRVVRGRFSFTQLKAWHDRVWPALLDLPGAVLTDVDEGHNRVRVGLEPGAARDRVEQILSRAGVPAEAVLLEETAPIREMATLRDRVRPLAGGLQIAFSNYLCTLGFHATRAGVQGFVVNSHCTDARGAVTPTVYYQPSASPANRIGAETTDPPFFTGSGCPSGRQCRRSDAAFARRDSGVTAAVGALQRTTGLDSLTIAGTYRIVSEGAVAVNSTLHKVGRTTGWTRGPVTSTCVNVSVSGTSLVMLCQGLVTAGVGPGDSGSPVFQVLNAQNDVRLAGILWGGGGGQFAYSPIANVQMTGELGVLDNCAAGFSC